MERPEGILVASVEPKPIATLVGCLVPALPARWSMNIDVAKVVGLCSQFTASGKKSEDPCLELLPGSRRRHLGTFFLCFPYTYKYLCEQDLCPMPNIKCTLCGCPFPMPENTRPNSA